MYYWGELNEEMKRLGKKMTHQEIVEALAKLEQGA
jgi:hypothetical protein